MSNDEKTTSQNSGKKTNSTRNQAPVKVIRVGAIAASIWKRQTSTGFEYLDFRSAGAGSSKMGNVKATRKTSSRITKRLCSR